MLTRRQLHVLSPPAIASRGGFVRTRVGPGRNSAIGFAPILDSERGVVAGFTACPARGRAVDGEQLARALAARDTMPRNTFLSIPLGWQTLAEASIRGELLRPTELSGVVFELVGVIPTSVRTTSHEVTRTIQEAGGLIALQVEEIWHHDFHALTEHAPKMIVVGQEWIRDVDTSERRRSVLQTLGQVAAERDAWVLGAGVRSRQELETLAELRMPLLRGPAIGGVSYDEWPTLQIGVTAALGPQLRRLPGPLRSMLVTVPTARTMCDAVARMLAAKDEPQSAVVLDGYGHPEGLAVRTEVGVRATRDVLCVHVDTALRDVVARASTRATSTDPVLAVDSAGRYLGVIPLSSFAR